MWHKYFSELKLHIFDRRGRLCARKDCRLLFLRWWEGRCFSGAVLFPGPLLVQLGFFRAELSLDFLSVWFCGRECMWEWVWVFVGEVLNGFLFGFVFWGVFLLLFVFCWFFPPSSCSPIILFAVLYTTWWACRSCIRYCLGTLLCKLFLTENNVSQVHFFTFSFVLSCFPQRGEWKFNYMRLYNHLFLVLKSALKSPCIFITEGIILWINILSIVASSLCVF